MRAISENINHYMFIGLGNPGREYEQSRHNVGFLAVDYIAADWEMSISRYQRKAMIGKKKIGEKTFFLVKPQTYMNLSGKAVSALVKYYKISVANTLVFFDDLDLPFGEIRLREIGGSSGQKGMRSIIDSFHTQDIPRLRIGVGRPPGRRDPADFILDTFSRKEQSDLPFILESCKKAAETFAEYGIEKAMTKFNHFILGDG